MTPEDLAGKVRFSTNRDGLNIQITATLEVRSVMSLDRVYEHNSSYVAQLKKELVLRLIQHLYEDQRDELYEAMEKFDCCNPMDFSGMEAAKNAIFKAARFQKPRLSKCCNARVKIGGGSGEGSTHWYECRACQHPCGIKPPVLE